LRNQKLAHDFFFAFFAAFFTFGLSFSGLCGKFNAFLGLYAVRMSFGLQY
jgi:hypothetical protein